MNSDQLAYLDAMGIDVWVERADCVSLELEPALEPAQEAAVENAISIEEPEVSLSEVSLSEFSQPETKRLEEAGNASVSEEKKSAPVYESHSEQVSGNTVVHTSATNGDNWDTLKEKVLSCVNCELHKTRTQAVFGVGNSSADLLIIGEAPGGEEDKQGEPFVGRAGQLLNAMLLGIGLKREQIYIANILKCRPPSNRDPKPEEVVCCDSYLRRQIELIQPKVILCVGRIAAQNLLSQETPIGKMRGQQYTYESLGIPVIVTYHPAYLLRSPTQKDKAWSDLLLANALLEDVS